MMGALLFGIEVNSTASQLDFQALASISLASGKIPFVDSDRQLLKKSFNKRIKLHKAAKGEAPNTKSRRKDIINSVPFSSPQK